MFCRKCGSSLPDDSLFCDKCGCSVQQESIRTPQNTRSDGTSYSQAKAKTWIEKLNLSTYQKANAILSLCAAIMLLICIDGSIYMWLYLLAAAGTLVLTAKRFDYRHILSAAVPSTILFSLIITDFVTAAAGQRVQAVNIIMQIIFAGAVAVLWLLCVHPNYKENNKTTAVLMMIGLICIAVNAIFLFISFFINLRYIGWNFRLPFGNLGNSAVLVSFVLFLTDEGKTLQWIKESLQTPTVQPWTANQSNTVSPSYASYKTPTENDIDDSVVCSDCGVHLPKDSLFCDNCGAPLQSARAVIENKSPDDDLPEQDEPILDTDDTVICPTCGSEVDGDSTFCEYCGAPISFPENIPLADEANDEESFAADDSAGERESDIDGEEVVCPKCGNVMPEPSEYCERCGEHIAFESADDDTNEKTNDAEPETRPYSYAQSPQEQSFETERRAESAPYIQNGYSQPKPPAVTAQTPPIVDERLGFLNRNEILMDEKLSVFTFANSYRIYDLNGNTIGAVQQVDISGGAKAARVLLGKGTKGFQQFHYKILDVSGKQLAAVHRDGGVFSQMRIVDSDEKTVGYLSGGKVYSPDHDLLCSFKSDWKGWNLTLTDPKGDPVGAVKKKWNGIGKELFTSADKYYITVNPSVTGNTRLAIFGMAIIYDILLHER